MVSRLGKVYNLNSWTFSGSSTPFTISDSAVVPNVSFDRDVWAQEDKTEWLFETHDEFYLPGMLLDAPFPGRISNLTADDFVISGTLTHYIDVLNVNRTMNPHSGTISDVIKDVLDEAGVDTTGLAVISADVVTLPGGYGNYWTMLNQFLAVHGMAMLLDPSVIVASPRILPPATLHEHTTPLSRSFGRGNPSRYIEVSYYNHEAIVDGEVYPDNVMESSVLQADAGEVVETEIQLTGWLATINQPVCVDFVEPDLHFYDGTTGVYSVSGADGLPITPAQWAGDGGWLRVELTDKPDVAKVTFRGPDMEQYAPYRIAMTSGNYYNSLRLTGEGVRYREESIRFPTGVDPVLTTEDAGGAIQVPAVANKAQALHQAAWLADRHGGADVTLNMSGDYEEVLSNRLIEYEDAVWLAQDVQVAPDNQSVTFLNITNLGDLEDTWAGKNLGDLEDVWAGRTLREWNLRPLWTGQ